MIKNMKPIDWPLFIKTLRSEDYGCFSQSDLSEEVGVYPDTIREWEHGRNIPLPKNRRALFAIAKELGIEKSHIPRKG